ncbi:hypothetical protein B0O79_3803 [Flavobacteriaceae bacterium MAR_2009_75]|nr:hypothetical protein B0O79_3803 [Flavobacteriaceae bacterium MAR_2009_75]
MRKIYITEKGEKNIQKADESTIKFLLDYSKSLKIMEANGVKFESNMN